MSTSNKMKIKDDPRIIANQQKILQYLAKVVDEQLKLKQMMRITMQETEKFQNDVYTSFRMLDARLDNTSENVESLHEVTDHINSRVKSIHRHIRGLQTNTDFTPTETDQYKMLNSTRQWNGISPSSRLPRTTKGLEAAISQRQRRPVKKSLLDDDNPSDSDESNVAQGAVGGVLGIRNPLDPNLQQRPHNGSSPKPNLQPNITGSSQAEQQRQVHSLNIQETENQSRSPVTMADRPPNNAHRPDTRKLRPTPGHGILDVSAIRHASRVRKLLLTGSPSNTDIQSLMHSYGVQLSSLSVMAIAKACKKNKAPTSRTVGLHTVVIVDTSSTVSGSPITNTKTFVNQLLDCVDNSAGEYGLEEHIAIVTCGATVDLAQPFTNDYMSLRSKLDTLVANGRSPLQASLALALCYLELNGESIEMYTHRIPPRVIVLSDFQVTSDKTFTGTDSDSSEIRISTQQQVFRLGELFHTQGYPIFCVPVGNCNQPVCDGLAKKTGGSVIHINTPDMAGNFYRYQAVIGCVINSYDTAMHTGGQECDMKMLIQQFLPQAGLTQADAEKVEELITEALERSDEDIDEMSIENDVTEDPPRVPRNVVHNRPRIETPEPDSNYVTSGTHHSSSPALPYLPEWTFNSTLNSLNFEERADLPLIGSRVVRDKDWKWGKLDGNGPGTVIAHKDKGLVYILWDNSNEVGSFRYRYKGDIFDVKVKDEPRAVGEQEIEIGCWVVRGPDWNRGDEDGGQRTVGVVIRKLPEREVMVRWPSRVIEQYKFGAENKWELQITMTKSLAPFQRSPSEETSQGTQTAAVPRNVAMIPAWFWQDSSSQWRIFEPDAGRKIESTYESKPTGNIMVHQQNQSVKIYLGQNRCEVNEQSRQIKRELVPENEIQNLYEVEKILSGN